MSANTSSNSCDGDSGNNIFSQTSFSDSEKDSNHRVVREETVTKTEKKFTHKKLKITRTRRVKSLSESDTTPPGKNKPRILRPLRRKLEPKKLTPTKSRYGTRKEMEVDSTAESEDETEQINENIKTSTRAGPKPMKKRRMVLPDSFSKNPEEGSFTEDS